MQKNNKEAYKKKQQDICVCCGAPIQTYGLGFVCFNCQCDHMGVQKRAGAISLAEQKILHNLYIVLGLEILLVFIITLCVLLPLI